MHGSPSASDAQGQCRKGPQGPPGAARASICLYTVLGEYPHASHASRASPSTSRQAQTLTHLSKPQSADPSFLASPDMTGGSQVCCCWPWI